MSTRMTGLQKRNHEKTTNLSEEGMPLLEGFTWEVRKWCEGSRRRKTDFEAGKGCLKGKVK